MDKKASPPPVRKLAAPSPASAARRRRNKNQFWIVGAALAAFASVLLILGSGILSGPTSLSNRGAQPQPPNLTERDKTPVVVGNSPNDNSQPENLIVDDDGETLWVSPTDGPPLDLAFLPPGVQLVVALRPRELYEHPEGEKVVDSLGPLGKRAIEVVEQSIGAPLRDVSKLFIAIGIGADGAMSTSLVASLPQPVSLAELRERLPGAREEKLASETYLVAATEAFFIPSARPDTLVVAPASAMPDIVELDGVAPPLRRDMERLVAHTDDSRQVTILVAPNFLFSEGRGLFSGAMAPLRSPLFWFLGDEFSASSLSFHWGDNFFAELVAVPTLETLPERASQILAKRIDQIPDRLQTYLDSLHPSKYSRQVVARLPAMLRQLASYTRRANERDVAILRSYLPVVAGHNLLLASELAIAESSGATTAVSIAPQDAPLSVADRLRKVTSLRFTRDTLETALGMLASDIGVEITILGADLQLEGITKNQSFAMDSTDRPAEEILVEILRKANPDKAASGPADPRQKLVYVIRPSASPGAPESIIVTTRAQAAQRGETLPAAFVSPSN